MASTIITFPTLTTLTGHFIRYTLLVLGWTPYYFQNCLNCLKQHSGRLWHSNKTQLVLRGQILA